MRLLHTSDISLHEFNDNEVPPYAILSHTWEKDEVTYHDFLQGKRNDKILRCCTLAASESWKYVWIDTCCIDKSSSAELSEAINSMYRWYEQAEVCYAYLVDISFESGFDDIDKHFSKSRWFTRGWTLQELLAPRRLIFVDADWYKIGSKQSAEQAVSEATQINASHLRFPMCASAAAKMSWMSRRKTTRTEDMAYCLLGLFKISMPLLYGEGEKAFMRLQEEIIKNSDDQSIFAWTEPKLKYSGMLAPRPSAFAHSGDIVIQDLFPAAHPKPYRMTNKGLEITLTIFDEHSYHEKDGCWRFEVPLKCRRSIERHRFVFITLEQIFGGKTRRINCSDINTLTIPRRKPQAPKKHPKSHQHEKTFFVSSETQDIWSTPVPFMCWVGVEIKLSPDAMRWFPYLVDVSNAQCWDYFDGTVIVDKSQDPSNTGQGVLQHSHRLSLSENTLKCRTSPKTFKVPTMEELALIMIDRGDRGLLVSWKHCHDKFYQSEPIKIRKILGGSSFFQIACKHYFSPETIELSLQGIDHWTEVLNSSTLTFLNISLRHAIVEAPRVQSVIVDIDVCQLGNKAEPGLNNSMLTHA